MAEDIYVLALLTVFALMIMIALAQQLDHTAFNAISAAATVLLAMATAYLALMGNRQLGVMESDQRPWVSAEIHLAGGITQNVNGANIPLEFIVKNTGRSPADHVFIHVEAIVDPEIVNLLPEQTNFCEAFRNTTPLSNLGVNVFPGDRLRMIESITISNEAINSALSHYHLPNISRNIAPKIIGCIDYQFAGIEAHHQSPFFLDLWEANAAGILLSIDLEHGDVPVERLRLYSSSVFGGRAD